MDDAVACKMPSTRYGGVYLWPLQASLQGRLVAV